VEVTENRLPEALAQWQLGDVSLLMSVLKLRCGKSGSASCAEDLLREIKQCIVSSRDCPTPYFDTPFSGIKNIFAVQFTQ